jgi:hypothetical protein
MGETDERQLQSPGAPLFGHLRPEYAGLARGIVLAMALVVIKAAIDYLTGGQPLPSGWDLYVPAILALLRSLEGVIDGRSVAAGSDE